MPAGRASLSTSCKPSFNPPRRGPFSKYRKLECYRSGRGRACVRGEPSCRWIQRQVQSIDPGSDPRAGNYDRASAGHRLDRSAPPSARAAFANTYFVFNFPGRARNRKSYAIGGNFPRGIANHAVIYKRLVMSHDDAGHLSLDATRASAFLLAGCFR